MLIKRDTFVWAANSRRCRRLHLGIALDFLVRKLRHGAWIDEDDERSLRTLYGGVRLVHARGDIIREGAPPRFLTLVLEGWACTYRDLGNGQRQILSILLPGDLAEPFGILPDLADSVLTLSGLRRAPTPGSSRLYGGICS